MQRRVKGKDAAGTKTGLGVLSRCGYAFDRHGVKCYTDVMSLTKRYLSRHKESIDFDPDYLARALKEACPEAIFALLLGSSKDGHISVGSDVDLALYMNERMSLDLLDRVQSVVERFMPGVHCDIGSLRYAEPVYRFEALKGRLLFTRDREVYLRFYSLTCREYETQLYEYDRQFAYRMRNHESGV